MAQTKRNPNTTFLQHTPLPHDGLKVFLPFPNDGLKAFLAFLLASFLVLGFKINANLDTVSPKPLPAPFFARPALSHAEHFSDHVRHDPCPDGLFLMSQIRLFTRELFNAQ